MSQDTSYHAPADIGAAPQKSTGRAAEPLWWLEMADQREQRLQALLKSTEQRATWWEALLVWGLAIGVPCGVALAIFVGRG